MIKYKIVQSFSSCISEAEEYLQKKINYWLERGWQLQGGISVQYFTTGTITACQAMIKEQETTKYLDKLIEEDSEIMSKLIEQYNYFHKEENNE